MYLQNRKVEVKNGRRTSLWLDWWLMEEAVYKKFPLLFELCSDRNKTVEDRLSGFYNLTRVTYNTKYLFIIRQKLSVSKLSHCEIWRLISWNRKSQFRPIFLFLNYISDKEGLCRETGMELIVRGLQ